MVSPTPETSSASVLNRSKLSPKRLYGFLAAAEMVTWALLIISMVLKYAADLPAFVRVFGMVHGVVFISYILVTIFVWANERWSFVQGLLGMGSAVIPFATLPFERSILRRGMLSDSWRLAPGGDDPHGIVEKLQATALRKPLLAALVGIVLVAVVTSVLLVVGPPGGSK
ncbi:MAG: DUF3817 domain-containing protein [Paeniglutamicibacter terrestris]|jgi:integral membrane protein|uniref:DUF3817 domain-containing protein n=1 Tax=Paeniglutamicibacter terrestris TaxID=2723403 RepID=A0ABX1GB23_9MICC|nr:DUF3817 domain-containing protein [Paeniglutamicibacter terrestris]ASN37608.1 hypothetical protein CGQ24_00340 [Arthrobacter sp. 7749]NKG22800.1 DUF3817 domain-containing protein [Paeniglutamicibacter terrestris]